MSTVQMQVLDQGQLERAQKLLQGIPGGVDRAAKAAMGRAVSHLRTDSARAIRERYDISAANIRANENVRVRYSYQEGVQAFVTFMGGKIPLFRYGGASPGGPAYDTSRRVPMMIHGQWRMAYPGLPAHGHQLKSTSFLSRLCKDAGLSLKATNNILVLFDQAAYEQKPPVRTIRRGGGYSKHT